MAPSEQANSQPPELVRQIQAIEASARSLQGEQDSKQILERVLEATRGAFGYESGLLYRVRGSTLAIEAAQNDRVAVGLPALNQLPPPTPLGVPTLAAHVVMTGAPYVADDAYTLTGQPFDTRMDFALDYRTRAVMAVPVPGPGGQVLGVLVLGHSEPVELPSGYAATAAALGAQAGLAFAFADHLARARADLETLVLQLAAIPEYRDPEVPHHLRRVVGYTEIIARAAGSDPETTSLLRLASALHDVGRVGTPDEILRKPGKLSQAEFERTKAHCRLGADLLAGRNSPLLRHASQIALSHHERWDGSGYPEGLRREAIPFSARVTALADVFDALTTRRSYKPAFGIDQSLQIIRQEAGRHFDPGLVEVFEEVVSQLIDVKRRYPAGGGDG